MRKYLEKTHYACNKCNKRTVINRIKIPSQDEELSEARKIKEMIENGK